VLDRSLVERLRNVPAAGPVVSVYLGLRPDLDQLRTIGTRVKALVQPLRDESTGKRLRTDLDRVVALAERAGGDLGRGMALFVGSEAGLEEHVSLPTVVRERAIIDTRPYLGPLEAMLAQFRRFCAVVVDRRTASIYRFYMGELETWEQIGEEEVRKDNYGGFAGYDEQRTRGHAEAVAQRLFRSVTARLADLYRGGGFELLIVGGQQSNVAGLVGELPPDLEEALAGTFIIDPGTSGPADIRTRCRALVGEFEQQIDEDMVTALLDSAGAGGRAAVGFDHCLRAANQRGIDTLLLDVLDLTAGARCPECGLLDDEPGACAACGSEKRVVPDLADALAEVTRGDGGTVRYLTADTKLAPHRVGAMLRFPVAKPGT